MRIIKLAVVLSLLALPFTATAQRDWDAVEIQTIELADGLYMLIGAGGNMALSVGEDGAFLIDDQFAPLSDKIMAAVAAVTDAKVKFVLNTHWHGDHTGGNEPFGASGAMIVAHENVRRRMDPATFTDVMGSSDQAADVAYELRYQFVGHGAAFFQICARAEGSLPAAGDEHAANREVLGQVLEQCAEATQGREREAVHHFRPLDGEPHQVAFAPQ